MNFKLGSTYKTVSFYWNDPHLHPFTVHLTSEHVCTHDERTDGVCVSFLNLVWMFHHVELLRTKSLEHLENTFRKVTSW